MSEPPEHRAESDGAATVDGLRHELHELTSQLLEARKQLRSAGEILRVISRSASDTQPVFETIAASARELCNAVNANVYVFDGTLLHVAALATTTAQGAAAIRSAFPRPADAGSAVGRAILTRSVVEIPDVLADADYRVQAAALAAEFRSGIGVPLMHEGEPIGGLAVGRPEPGPFPEAQVVLLQTFAEQAVIAIRNARLMKALQDRGAALARSLEDLRRETESHGRSKATIAALLEDLRPGSHALVGRSRALERVRERMAQVARTDSTVLIQGETGTGKEVVARAIHLASRRSDKPLITLNCAALPRELIESELFGHEKGAFTGATQQRRGRFELADGGTLFLDEIGELPLEAQAKLLRVLQDGGYERLGGTRAMRADVRVVVATNRNLRAEVDAGRFRADLFFRLNVFPIELPALRERREDIPLLVHHFVAQAGRRFGPATARASASFIERACAYDWPGNVRELANLVERALILGGGSELAEPSELFPASAGITERHGEPPALTLEAVERGHVRAVLEQTQWRIEGPSGAAAVLGLRPSTLRARMQKLGLKKPV